MKSTKIVSIFLSIILTFAFTNSSFAKNSTNIYYKNTGEVISLKNFVSPYFPIENFSNKNFSIKEIKYVTLDSNNKKRKVSGLFFNINTPKLYRGKKALAVIAPGTQGQNTNCATSKQLEILPGVSNNLTNFEYEMLAVKKFLDKGFSVAVTDYIGLNSPGMHTYLNKIDQGHAVLDIAKAAIKTKSNNLDSDAPIVFYGYSQGGGAVGSALEMQKTYAKKLNIKGGFMGAPPSNLLTIAKTVEKSSLVGTLGYAANGFMASSDEVNNLFNSLLSGRGKRILKNVAKQCAIDTINSYKYTSSSSWFKNKKSFYKNIISNKKLLKILTDNSLGNTKPLVPTYIYVNAKDDLILPSQANELHKKWKSKGAKNLVFEADNSILSFPAKTAGNHFAAVPTAVDKAIAFLTRTL